MFNINIEVSTGKVGALERKESIMKNLMKGEKLKIGGKKIDLSPYIKESKDGCVIGRLDDVTSKEDVVIDERKNPPKVTTSLQNMLTVARLYTKVNGDATTPTLVFTVKKKNYEMQFPTSSPLGELSLISTLSCVYRSYKKEWVDLNKSTVKDRFTNVMYVPKVAILLNDNGKVIKPYNVNVLIVALASPKNIKLKEDELLNNEEKVGLLVADIMNGCIKMGCKNVILNPFSYKFLYKNANLTTEAFVKITESAKFQEQFNTLTFAFECEDDFIKFEATKKALNNFRVKAALKHDEDDE